MPWPLLAMVTDYDGWHPRETPVSANRALAKLLQNAGTAQRVVAVFQS